MAETEFNSKFRLRQCITTAVGNIVVCGVAVGLGIAGTRIPFQTNTQKAIYFSASGLGAAGLSALIYQLIKGSSAQDCGNVR